MPIVPRIGLTMRLELETNRFYLGRHYCEALEYFGAVPLHIPLIPKRDWIRALVETLIDPAPALAAIKAREPIIDLDVERQRWDITRRYLLTDESRANGLGGVRTGVLQRQIDEVVEVFDLPAKPSLEQIFDDRLLPAADQRKVPA